MRLTLLTVACALLCLRLYRRTADAVALLQIPARWPACVPDGGASSRPAPTHRRSFGGARFAVVSTWLPTRCGIATYSAGLRDGLLATGASVDVVAVHLRSSEEHVYGPEARYGAGFHDATQALKRVRRSSSPYVKTSRATMSLRRTTSLSRRALTARTCCTIHV